MNYLEIEGRNYGVREWKDLMDDFSETIKERNLAGVICFFE